MVIEKNRPVDSAEILYSTTAVINLKLLTNLYITKTLCILCYVYFYLCDLISLNYDQGVFYYNIIK